ncbi:MAG: hypothetical protein K0R79_3455 [Stenotrophomonas indicatrix]|jgi:hypothetical protein|uniref:hypothetical protein n=1 Tax=Stenotrophomonas indicatrix TaxID=2045451 RepID=UPI00242FE09F|nr:hypothetical protein [Stenotrophomonas indicatrix]MDF2483098.1 hypothetical protein [Stenotrophomonas indicatrix]
MSARNTYPNLRRLVGESADQLPADIAERIEDVLAEPSDLLPALMARMDGRDNADGQTRKGTGLSPSQAVTLASLSRTLAGLNALIQMLHAAEAARVQGSAGQQLPPDVVEGLLLAARELARYARQQLE